MYVAVKGGEAAILNSYRLLAAQRRGDTALPELSVAQIRAQLKLAVDRVMTEGSVYDPELAALAIKQAAGDLVEAIFLLRAYRATLPRLGTTCALDTARMTLQRRVSATFKDLPGGQVLGPTYDYTQRLLDFTLLANAQEEPAASGAVPAAPEPATPRVVDLLNQEGLIETRPMPPGDPDPMDLTREPFCGRDPLRRGGAGGRARGAGFCDLHRRPGNHRMRDGQPVRRQQERAAAVHARLRPGLRPQ